MQLHDGMKQICHLSPYLFGRHTDGNRFLRSAGFTDLSLDAIEEVTMQNISLIWLMRIIYERVVS